MKQADYFSKEELFMEQFMGLLKKRHSVRDYSARQVERADLDALLEAAYRTPNAGNRQGTRIVVSKDRALNERLGRAQNVIYEKFNARQPLSLSDGEIASTSRSGFYNAPTVIYLFAPNQFLFAEPDSYIKAFSLCLAAAERDIDSCIISVAADYFIDDFGKSVLKAWNIPKTHHISAHVILGYGRGKDPEQKAWRYEAPLFVEEGR